MTSIPHEVFIISQRSKPDTVRDEGLRPFRAGTRRVFAKTAFMAGDARKAGDGAKAARMAEEL